METINPLKDAVPLDQVRRALVIKLRHHGDVLLAAPVLSSLKAAAPADGSDALIFADNAKQAAVANMYHALLGRNADAGGLEFWYDHADGTTTLHTIASGFLESAEYTAKDQDDAEFVDALYAGLFGRPADAAGADYWLDRLEDGASRADVATAFAEASVDGAEVEIVGTVTIIDPTV